jgi:hypothetical protein
MAPGVTPVGIAIFPAGMLQPPLVAVPPLLPAVVPIIGMKKLGMVPELLLLPAKLPGPKPIGPLAVPEAWPVMLEKFENPKAVGMALIVGMPLLVKLGATNV